MSTHSLLGVRKPDGTITGCYVHFDGYPEHMVDALRHWFANGGTMTSLQNLIEEARSQGGLRSFYAPHSDLDAHLKPRNAQSLVTRTSEFLGDDHPYGLDTYDWNEERALYKWGASYAYLVEDPAHCVARRAFGPEGAPRTRTFQLDSVYHDPSDSNTDGVQLLNEELHW